MVELSAWSCLVGTGAKIEQSGAVTKEVFFFFFSVGGGLCERRTPTM